MEVAEVDVAAAEGRDRQFVTALARGLQILSCFSSTTPELSGSELAKLTGLPQPTVWRLCHTMLELGMLISTAGDRMRPGLPVLRLGISALAGLDVVELARPHMQEAANHYRAACGLATRQGLQMVMIERCHGDNPLLTNLRRGSVFQVADSGLGWACLAGLPAHEREALIAEIERDDAQRWKAARKAFRAALADYEENGFIVNSGIFHPDYHTVAVPVFDRNGQVHCGLNCGAPISTLPTQKLRKEVGPKLVSLARMLEAGMVLD
ncbi:MAG: IclR family transcriptional regulator [Burkholderiaceae bacterium]